MAGAAVKGISKILRRKGKGPLKGPVKRPRGTPTKAGLMARRGILRGDKDAPKASDLTSRREALRGVKAPKKKPLVGKFELGVGTGAGAVLAYQELKKGQKKAKAKTDKLAKEAFEKDKKKKKSYGKRAPKKDKYYRGR